MAGIVPAVLGQVGEGLHEEELVLNILWDGFLGQEFLCILGGGGLGVSLSLFRWPGLSLLLSLPPNSYPIPSRICWSKVSYTGSYLILMQYLTTGCFYKLSTINLV